MAADLMPRDDPKVLFDQYDQNKDGKVDFVEYVRGRYQKDFEIPIDELKVIAKMDRTKVYIETMYD